MVAITSPTLPKQLSTSMFDLSNIVNVIVKKDPLQAQTADKVFLSSRSIDLQAKSSVNTRTGADEEPK